jgi:predicted DNA-binding transcriptional regulator YafY
MRADRLLSLLMMLQSRGRMTASQLAKELEVSERTIYRDIEALSTAGVPVYAERGPGGGCSLLESYRTNLTGLTADEVQALFMLTIPTPLAKLGVTQELKAALLKLSAALPSSHRGSESFIRQRIHLDSSWWFQSEEPTPFLQQVYQAVWEDRKLLITYRLKFEAQFEKLIEPLGLVAKAGIWYLVYSRDDRIRFLRVSRIVGVQLTEETFARPANFDLADAWQSFCKDYEKSHSHYPVRLRVAPDFVPLLPHYFGESVREKIKQEGLVEEEGWIEITLSFETLLEARDRILGFGRAVEVLEPEALRKSIIDFATQIASFYRDQRK